MEARAQARRKAGMPKPQTPIPERLGRYEILDRIAWGGMAEIFFARERGVAGLERFVVVKRILPHLAERTDLIDMFLQEARLVAQLTHPHVVQIHELGQDGADFFIAMEYISGSSVREILAEAARRQESIPVGVAVGLVAQACAGAHAAHELTNTQGKHLGLVHRDVTPHNLMVTAEGHVKLLDFGVAKSTLAADQTLTGSLKGKLYYLSPEQCRYEKLDRRSDIFSLGVILWELLVGRRLFKRENEIQTLQAIAEEQVPDPRSQRTDVPIGLSAVCACALTKDRDERFTTADEMRRALLGAAEEDGLDASTDAIADVVKRLCGESQAESRSRLKAIIDQVETISSTSAAVTRSRSAGVGVDLEDDSIYDAETMITDDGAGTRRPTTTGKGASTGTSWSRMAVRGAALLFALAVAAGALWWARYEGPPVVAGAVVTIGFAPAIDPALIARELVPLEAYLERATGRPFTLTVAASYRDLSTKLLGGQYQFALLPPNLYIETHERDSRVGVSLAARYAGSQGSDGVLLVREDSPVQALADMRGRRFCYTDPDSTSGYLLPRASVRGAGVDPDRDMKPPLFSGDHQQTLMDLLVAKCDVAGTFNSNVVAAGRAGVPVDRLRVLALTGRLPHEAFCAGPGTSAEERQLVEEALGNFDPQRHTRSQWLGKVQRISGFDRVGDSDYDALRAALGKPASGPAAAAEDAGGSEDAHLTQPSSAPSSLPSN